ncbi:MAG: YeeE/YedE family protein [Hahellaceae bacterium]|nr:YeeE/YedE family protein [Hahellaceae bacterium]
MIDSLFPNGVLPYLAGGICIGLAVSLIFILTGQVAGMSSVFSSTLSWLSRRRYFQQPRLRESRLWRLYLAGGLILGTALYWFGFGPAISWQTSVPLWQLAVGGFIAGFGARLGNGCTSGHGICGMASLQGLSILSVLIFLSVAIGTAQLIAYLQGI